MFVLLTLNKCQIHLPILPLLTTTLESTVGHQFHVSTDITNQNTLRGSHRPSHMPTRSIDGSHCACNIPALIYVTILHRHVSTSVGMCPTRVFTKLLPFLRLLLPFLLITTFYSFLLMCTIVCVWGCVRLIDRFSFIKKHCHIIMSNGLTQ